MHPGHKRQVLCATLLVTPVITRSARYQMTCDASISERWKYRQEMADQIYPTIATSTEIVGVLYMPQSCDMGQMALLPLQRKAC
jgi:hypothetical protein